MGISDAISSPEALVTRAELAQVVYRFKGLGQTMRNESPFTDVQGHWAENMITAVQAAGIMRGFEDGSFQPDQIVTQAESVEVINLMFSRLG